MGEEEGEEEAISQGQQVERLAFEQKSLEHTPVFFLYCYVAQEGK